MVSKVWPMCPFSSFPWFHVQIPPRPSYKGRMLTSGGLSLSKDMLVGLADLSALQASVKPVGLLMTRNLALKKRGENEEEGLSTRVIFVKFDIF